jgi:NAD(P)-dependent dehydrogenase (short-subunit alcohol dehydrogenase family)
MRILLIGATGTIGRAVKAALEGKHEVLAAGYSDGDYRVDLASPESIAALFEQVGPVDAVISTAGQASFGPLASLSDEAFQEALNNKLMGQVNLLRLGQAHVNDGGSITLTSGLLAREPMPGSVAISMANGALDSFVKAASLETERGIRINAVSPAFVKETMERMGMDPTSGVSAADTAQAYVAAIEGNQSGSVLPVTDFL